MPLPTAAPPGRRHSVFQCSRNDPIDACHPDRNREGASVSNNSPVTRTVNASAEPPGLQAGRLCYSFRMREAPSAGLLPLLPGLARLNGQPLAGRWSHGLTAKAGIWFLVGSWQGRIRAFRVRPELPPSCSWKSASNVRKDLICRNTGTIGYGNIRTNNQPGSRVRSYSREFHK